MGLADETRASLAEAETLFEGARDALRPVDGREPPLLPTRRRSATYEVSRAAGERACAVCATRPSSKGLEEVAEAHLAISLLGLGTAGPVRDEDALRRALDLVREQVRRADALGSPYARVTAYTNIAAPLLELGRLDEASTYVRHAIELGRGHGFALPYAAMDGGEGRESARPARGGRPHPRAVSGRPFRKVGGAPGLRRDRGRCDPRDARARRSAPSGFAVSRARGAKRTSLDEALELALSARGAG